MPPPERRRRERSGAFTLPPHDQVWSVFLFSILRNSITSRAVGARAGACPLPNLQITVGPFWFFSESLKPRCE
jgi:hypothetical protein